MGKDCVCCGICVRECPQGARVITSNDTIVVDEEKCIHCKLCEVICPLVGEENE